MGKLKYTFKNDTLFKMLFVRHRPLLQSLVAALLGLAEESIGNLVINNPEIPPENLGDKFCRLDISMIIGGQRVDLELQVRNEGDYPQRALFHWAREYSSALPAGDDYENLPRTIIISILNFNQFDCAEFHSEFCPLEVKRHELLSDRMSLHFFELKKLPVGQLNAGDKLQLWLALFKAETQEELAKIDALEVPDMKEAINAYNEITVTPEFREMERLRFYARHNEASALRHAREQGEKRGEKKGVKQGRQEGIEQGLQKGIEQGLQKGIEQGRQQILELLKSGKPLEEIIKEAEA